MPQQFSPNVSGRANQHPTIGPATMDIERNTAEKYEFIADLSFGGHESYHETRREGT